MFIAASFLQLRDSVAGWEHFHERHDAPRRTEMGWWAVTWHDLWDTIEIVGNGGSVEQGDGGTQNSVFDDHFLLKWPGIPHFQTHPNVDNL